jgi:hypothetical protein
MNDQLDHAVRSVLTDIISTAPKRQDQPIRMPGVVEMPSRARRPYLMVAAAALAVVGVGGVAFVSSRDTGNTPVSASTPTASAPAAVATSAPDTATTVGSLPPGRLADLQWQIEIRVAEGEANLAALGFTNYEYSTTADEVTTLRASDPSRPNGMLTIVMTPGTVLQPEAHSRTPVTVVAQTSTLIRVENHSNDGWTFSVEFVDNGGGLLPTVEQLQELIYSFDPRARPPTGRSTTTLSAKAWMNVALLNRTLDPLRTAGRCGPRPPHRSPRTAPYGTV